MKISVDDKEVFTLSENQKKVIMNDISEDIFEEDMKRRLQYILIHKYERCFERFKKEWEKKLTDRVDSIPTNCDKFCNLVFSQSDYKSRKQKDNESIKAT